MKAAIALLTDYRIQNFVRNKMEKNGGQASQVHKIVIKWKKVKIGGKHGQKTKNTLPGCILSYYCSG